MLSLRYAVDLQNQCKSVTDYTFSVVPMDHATTLILLDKLRSKKGKILKRSGYVIDFYDSMNNLINQKSVAIPEYDEISAIHSERDKFLHIGETVSKQDSQYYIKKTLEFFERFLMDEYKMNLPNFASSKTEQHKKIPKHKTIKTSEQLFPRKKIPVTNPTIVFYQNYKSIYALINLLGYKHKILSKGNRFNFKNLKNLKKLDFISSHDYKLLSQSMMMYERTSTGDLEQKISEIKKLSGFLVEFRKKLRAHSTESLPKQIEELDVDSLIKLLNQSDSMPKRVKGKEAE